MTMNAFTRNSLKVTVAAAVTAVAFFALAGPASATHEPLHTSVTTVSPGWADLVPVRAQTANEDLYYVKNVGNAYARSSYAALRTCGGYSPAVSVAGLAPGAYALVWRSSWGRLGTFHVDWYGHVAESNEYNNRTVYTC
jgi:hypothetical protein